MVAFQNAIAEVPNHAVFDVFETLARVFTKVYEMLTPRILQAFRVGSWSFIRTTAYKRSRVILFWSDDKQD